MKAKQASDSSPDRAVRGPEGKAVQQMFAEIAPREYVRKHLLSVSIDRRWRRIAVAKARESISASAAPIVLDLCSGTGDLAIDLHERLRIPVVASDFCHPMLVRSLAKMRHARIQDSTPVIEADSLTLPFAERTFDVATVAFGLRNLEDPVQGLGEMK